MSTSDIGSTEPLNVDERDPDHRIGRVVPPSNDASINIETNATPNDPNDNSFTDLLYLLLWKNRKFVSTPIFIAKLLCPWVLLLIVGAASTASSTYNVNCIDKSGDDCPDILYQPHDSITHGATDLKSYSGHMLASKLCPDPNTYPGYLGFIPHPSSSLYLQFIQTLSQNIGFPATNTTCNRILNSLHFSQDSLLKFFDSRDDFIQYINADDYASTMTNTIPNRRNSIPLLITMNSINLNEIDYTISVNDTHSQVDTRTTVDHYTQDVDVLFNASAMPYMNSGFVAFQSWIDQSIIRVLHNHTNIIINGSSPYDYVWNYFVYPSTKFERNTLWEQLLYQWPTLIMFMYMMPVIGVLTNLVGEKVEGMREMLRIMGTTQSMYWLSWFIWNAMEVTVIPIGIAIIGKLVGVVFSSSNILIIFLYFWGFGLSQVGFFSFLSVFVNNLKLAGFIGGFGLWVLSFTSQMVVLALSNTAKRWLCIIPNFAFSAGTVYIAEWETKQIGVQWDNINTPIQPEEVSMAFVIFMLFADAILFSLLTIYFDNIVPSSFGKRKKWNYICQRRGSDHVLREQECELVVDIEPCSGTNYEETVSNYRPYFAIRNIEKEFKSKSGLVQAVNGVNLDLNKGEVFCLLGHNGAGKTTLISILTGLINSTKGTAYVDEYELNRDMDVIRQWIGFCPQKDILWPTMTPYEHLWLYAKVKGVEDDAMEQEIDKIMTDTGIKGTDFEKKRADKLSGGEKRKLCLAIALVGDSKIVFLDEPTSGMDPQNRRLVWDLIEKEKQKRCIILTTHYMEEADTLGDKIAIMSHGKIECCGSSLFLKKIYSVGYTFTVSTRNGDDNDNDCIDNCILDQIKNSKRISYVNNEIKYQLPFEESHKFSQLFKELDDRKESFNINNYGLSMTTLQQVFLKIGETTNANGDQKCVELFEEPATFEANGPSNGFSLQIYAILYKMIKWQTRDWDAIWWRIIYPPFLLFLMIGINYSAWGKPDGSLPIVHFNTSMYYEPPSLNIIGASDDSFDAQWMNAYEDTLQFNGELHFGDMTPIDTAFPTKTFQSFLYQNKGAWNDGVISYGSMVLNPLDMNRNIYLGINVSSYHSLPIMINLYNNWILNRYSTQNAVIRTSNWPTPKTDIQAANESKLMTQIFGITTVVLLVFAFIMIPTSAVYFIVNERKVKTKHQQFVNGISVYAYYMGTFLGDAIGACPCLLILFVFMLFMPGTDAFRTAAYFPSLITAIFFILSSFPYIYWTSFAFQKPGRAVAFSGLFMFVGLIPLMVRYIANLEFSDATEICLQCLFGSYCAAGTLLNYQMKLNFFPHLFDSFYSWEASGQAWFIMFCQLVVHFGILFLVEYLQTLHQLSLKLGFTINAADDKEDADAVQDGDVLNEQKRLKQLGTDDVIAVRGLRKVYKSKPEHKVAVKDMWFGVGRNEIFGFLGTNGAGKTSTLSMLTGDIFPSAGSASINGISIYEQNKIRKFIGYAAQSDTLFDKLTAAEHLRFYGLLKGLNAAQLEKQMNMLLTALSLHEHKNKASSELSGGNKRKLSVAIAMIGNAPIIFLDEPSTGIDPSTRSNMQQFILRTMNGRSVILTTHSMEECEALSNKIGIMVQSELKCLGTTQHLKSKFGRGFQIAIIIKKNVNEEERDNDAIANQMNRHLNEYFESEVIERHNLNLSIRIKPKQSSDEEQKYDGDHNGNGGLTLSKIFQIMEEMKDVFPIQSYGVSQPKLENVFLTMAQMEDDEEEDGNENKSANTVV